MIVELELDQGCHGIVVVLGGIVVDVGLAAGVAKIRGALARRHHPLILRYVLPPAVLPVSHRQVVLVEIVFEVGHGAGGKGQEHDRLKRRLQQRRRGVGLLPRAEQA